MTALDELAREVGTSGRTLRRAAQRGLIRARRPTPHKIELAYAEREYVRTRWETIAALLEALRTEPNVKAAAVYGSFARGTDIADVSDIDVLVTLDRDGSQPAWELEQRLTERVDRAVHVVRLSEAERDPQFLLSALHDARPLTDRSGEWQLLQARIGQLRRAARQQTAQRRDTIARDLARLGS
jgi:predicted nucleotidyltransferase